MKRLFSFIVLMVVSLLILISFSSCSTPRTTAYVLDKEGNVTSVFVTEERDAFDKITESTKNKTCIAWRSGWIASIQATIATPEEPFPLFRVFGGKIDKGLATILPDQKNLDKIPDIIQATKQNFSIDPTGIVDQPQKETSAAAHPKE